MTNARKDGSRRSLYVAMELSSKRWVLAFTDLVDRRFAEVLAWDRAGFQQQLKAAKRHFQLPAAAAVHSCYEAGRDGFSVDAYLKSLGVKNLVVDPASIEVSRRAKHRKTDRLDAGKLLVLLVRYVVHRETGCWRVCRVPGATVEAERTVDREYDTLKKEHKQHRARIRSLLAAQGVRLKRIADLTPGLICDWSGRLLEPSWQKRFARELARLALVEAQLKEMAAERRAALKAPSRRAQRDAAKLHELKAIGPVGAMALATQFFWRDFANTRQVGAAGGLTSCPYNSGGTQVDQGISKAGYRRIRSLAVELAWMWLRYQSQSALARWYQERFGGGSKRLRRIGIVALARKLLIALWKYLRFDIVPEGAVLRPKPKAART